MAVTTITRSTVTDDDGSGTVGTIWNGALLSTAIYSRIDALLASSSGFEIRGPFIQESSDENSIQTAGGVRERGRAASMGVWTNVAHAATDFGTSTAGSTWICSSGDQTARRYMVIGKTLFYGVTLLGTSVGTGSPTGLVLDLPTGFVASGDTRQAVRYTEPANGGGYGVATIGDTETALTITTATGAAWSSGTDNVHVAGMFVIPIA